MMNKTSKRLDPGPRLEQRINFRVPHAVVGGLAGGFLATAILAMKSGTDALVIVGLSAFAFAGVGYAVGRAHDRLWAESATDSLTGLANRRYFAQRLKSALSAASRREFPLALLLIDVDRLKEINDRLGHCAGDAALRAVAGTLRRICRSSDVLARCGGDEFAVLAPFTSLDAARDLAQRILSELPVGIDRRAEKADFSVSIGVAAYWNGIPDHDLTANCLVDAADCALYAAKATGRDRVVVDEGGCFSRTDEAAGAGLKKPPSTAAAAFVPDQRAYRIQVA